MNNFFFILTLATLFSILVIPHAFSQISTATTDSSKITSSQFSEALNSKNSTPEFFDNSHDAKNCRELRTKSSEPRIKIFEPDTTLTASMPILTPAPLDQGIFIPGFECIKPDSLD